MLRKGDWHEAAAAYREAIRLSPNHVEAHFRLGNALWRQKALADAARAYEGAIRLKPDYAEAHCNLGGVLKEMGRFAEAAPLVRRGHELGSQRESP